jgi:protein SCO1
MLLINLKRLKMLKFQSAILTILIASNLSCKKQPEKTLPKIYQIKKIDLVNQEGENFSPQKMKGSLWVVHFIFTRCQGPCPVLIRTMGKLQKDLQNYPQIKFLSLSADPKRDTPADLKRYALKQKADFNRWTFLTGKTAEVMRTTEKEFKIPADKDNPDAHSTRFVLVDENLNIRGFYSGLEVNSMEKLIQDAKKLAKDMPLS